MEPKIGMTFKFHYMNEKWIEYTITKIKYGSIYANKYGKEIKWGSVVRWREHRRNGKIKNILYGPIYNKLMNSIQH